MSASPPPVRGGPDGAFDDAEVGKLAIRLANAGVLPMVLKSAIELNVIDLLVVEGDAYLSASEIAGRIPTKNPEAPVLLDRMLGLLASHSIVKCRLRTGEEGSVREYCAEPICKFLTSLTGNEGEGGGGGSGSGSVAPLLLLHHDQVLINCWYHLNDVILEGGIAFERAYGKMAFDYNGTDERYNKVFNQGMSNHTTMIINEMVNTYKGFDFEGLKVLVDVGGGVGVTLKIITSKYPRIKGINFDLPHVIAHAPPYSGVEHVGGDMFASIPNADAIFMKWILHDWSDEHCLKLLKNCYKALPECGKVIIVESIRPELPKNDVSSNIVFDQDLLMLAVNPGGKERTLEEYETLAINSGFAKCLVICSLYNSWVMEFHKGSNF
ncbi:Plant methyltransferase dimerization [Dillenia turbinata]|uniref:Plant methyltransferase dimerization n=1 Tax=Dillenia turbinata TaxID=194707 RepID=A0AAN8ZHQ5_9MAGN